MTYPNPYDFRTSEEKYFDAMLASHNNGDCAEYDRCDYCEQELAERAEAMLDSKREGN